MVKFKFSFWKTACFLILALSPNYQSCQSFLHFIFLVRSRLMMGSQLVLIQSKVAIWHRSVIAYQLCCHIWPDQSKICKLWNVLIIQAKALTLHIFIHPARFNTWFLWLWVSFCLTSDLKGLDPGLNIKGLIQIWGSVIKI